MKILIPESHRFNKWMCINGAKVTECLNLEITKEEHNNNSDWTIVKPKRSSKSAFYRRMREKYLNKKNNKH